jgi:hypothetical protein
MRIKLYGARQIEAEKIWPVSTSFEFITELENVNIDK